MLTNLYIKNIVLINELEVNLHKGLNVLTGETGAGKSIILYSLKFLSGDRADKSFMRHGSNECKVSAEYTIDYNTKMELVELLEEEGIIKEDNILLIERTLYLNGKNICKINNQKVSLSTLKKISSNLIDICSQHENISLLDSKTHINILDNYINEPLYNLKNDLIELIKDYKAIVKIIKENGTSQNVAEKTKEIKNDLKLFNLIDINSLDYDALFADHKISENSIDISNKLSYILDIFSNEEDNSISFFLNDIMAQISSIEDFSKEFKAINNRINSSFIELNDINQEIKILQNKYYFDQDKAQELDNKIKNIAKLEQKHGHGYVKLMSAYTKLEEELDFYDNYLIKLEKYNKDRISIASRIYVKCLEISNIRREYAVKLEKLIQEELSFLGMKNTLFKIAFSQMPDKNNFLKELRINGFDKVEFMISTNVGSAAKNLNKIISGGEMSRFMLALKTILFNTDMVELIVFDEIDTGISGNTVNMVGQKIKQLSNNKQIILVTHLAQIASYANQHYLVEKFTKKNSTHSTVKLLKDDEQIMEISRLLSGNTSKISIEHAMELISKAKG